MHVLSLEAGMRRREFLGVAGGALTWPLAATAQPSTKLPTIGFFSPTTPTTTPQRTVAFVQRLRELGWEEGRSIVIEYRWGEGLNERPAEIAAEFVRLKVDVIVTSGTLAVRAVKNATSSIPVVFTVLADPVGDKIVASLARPGGNITGLSNQSTELAPKRLELLREIKPRLRYLGILSNADNPGSKGEALESTTAARALGIEVVIPELNRSEQLIAAFDEFRERVEAIYVVSDPLVNANRLRIHTLSVAARIPTIYNTRELVENGGLLSYGPNFLALHRRAAEFVDKILRGAKPADLPVEQPTKFDLAFNLTTAKALGLTIPPTLLSRADEVIE
jgi:putative ABC transport system substrate-binding protein